MLSLEIVPLPVSDIDSALAFYCEQAGFTLDIDYRPTPAFRIVQLTPPGSACSVHLVAADSPSRVHGLCLVTTDLPAEREKLLARGVAVGAVRHKDPVETWAGGWSSVLIRSVATTPALLTSRTWMATRGSCKNADTASHDGSLTQDLFA